MTKEIRNAGGVFPVPGDRMRVKGVRVKAVAEVVGGSCTGCHFGPTLSRGCGSVNSRCWGVIWVPCETRPKKVTEPELLRGHDMVPILQPAEAAEDAKYAALIAEAESERGWLDAAVIPPPNNTTVVYPPFRYNPFVEIHVGLRDKVVNSALLILGAIGCAISRLFGKR